MYLTSTLSPHPLFGREYTSRFGDVPVPALTYCLPILYRYYTCDSFRFSRLGRGKVHIVHIMCVCVVYRLTDASNVSRSSGAKSIRRRTPYLDLPTCRNPRTRPRVDKSIFRLFVTSVWRNVRVRLSPVRREKISHTTVLRCIRRGRCGGRVAIF